MKTQGLRRSDISKILFGDSEGTAGMTQAVLDAAAQAMDPESPDPNSALRLLPWRAHLFQKAQGGIWACVDPDCSHRDPELMAKGAD
jgi:DEAD/DEAH box helicase domain-containing protein